MRFLKLSIAAFCASVVCGYSIDRRQGQDDSREEASTHPNLEDFAYYGGASPDPTATAGLPLGPTGECGGGQYWLENIKHQGVAAFNADPGSYQVFRNVKDFGAKGDGKSDDTTAIQKAISDGGRCAPVGEQFCNSSTTTPAIVYFPAGTYVVSTSIINYYYTQIMGDPLCMPVLKAAANWTGGFGMIDGDAYTEKGLAWIGVNIFFRQIRNIVLDMTSVPPNVTMTGIHWPTAQVTSITNVVFYMSDAPGTQHQGLFGEEGSGGYMGDLTFYGGNYGMFIGNQQFTFRNIQVFNAKTAINQLWNWGWTYKGMHFTNCSVGFNISSGGHEAQTVGSLTLFDSSMTDVGVGILTVFDATSKPVGSGSLIMENIELKNVPVAVAGLNSTILPGTRGSTVITAWGQGNIYTPNGPNRIQGYINPNIRPASLIKEGKYYDRSKPQYEKLPLSEFLSARDAGVKGDGNSDDTQALQKAITDSVQQKKVLFLDHGDYLVSRTIYIPSGARIVGESFSVILSNGPYFDDMANPKPVVQVGKPGEIGYVEWSDTIVSTQGRQRGAIVIEYNLKTAGEPSGLWDVHARIGGFTGSRLTVAECPKTPNITHPPVNENCIAAFLTMHITKCAGNLYMENNWMWVADHDIDDAKLTQTPIYAGRGLLVESETGPLWLYGTAVEHHVLYEYQFAGTRDVFMGQIQTETAYYQSNPDARYPFPTRPEYKDPVFPAPRNTSDAKGWGLRVLDSQSMLVYGAGIYSFFENWSVECANAGDGADCQNRIVSLEGNAPGAVSMYNLNTVGTRWMLTVDGKDTINYKPNQGSFADNIALYRDFQ